VAFSPFLPIEEWNSNNFGASGYFDGTGDYITVANSSAVSLGTGDFTMEAWVYPITNKTIAGIVCKSPDAVSTGFVFSIDSGTLVFKVQSNNISSSTTVSRNTWSHVACTRQSGNVRMFLNGTLLNGTIDSGNINGSSGNLRIGTARSFGSTSNHFFGYICDLRVIKNSALYTNDFTIPSSPLSSVGNTSLLCNFSNIGIYDSASKNALVTVDNAQISTDQNKWGVSSIYLDGTGDYITIPDNPNLRFGNSAFTIESWIYRGAENSAHTIYSKGNTNTGFALQITSSNKLRFNAETNIDSTSSISGYTWFHVAVVRANTEANGTSLYINGTRDAVGTISTNFNQIEIANVGINRNSSESFNGYLQDLRITNGVARYNVDSFILPTNFFPRR